jgi:hypothetical protein
MITSKQLNQSAAKNDNMHCFLPIILKSDDPDFNNQLGFNKHNVLEVYYEATFMRDFWFQNKEKFNRALWEYLADREFEFANKTYEDTEKHPNHWGKSMKHPLASWMMNAKPDVAVLLKQKESYKLYFLECKYMSDIDVYTNPSTSIVKNQTVIQKDILDFLCNKIKLQYNGKKIIKGDVKLVRFTLKESKPIKDKHNQISVAIEDLIKYGYK